MHHAMSVPSLLQAELQHDSTLRTLLSVYLPQHTLTSQAIKAQFNAGESAVAVLQSPFPSPGRACSCIVTAQWPPMRMFDHA